MDVLSSAEFRKRYASLRGPVAVTVNGHIIGRWVPGAAEYVIVDGKALSGDEQRLRAAALEWPEDPPPIFEPGFNTRPFTPVPKKGK